MQGTRQENTATGRPGSGVPYDVQAVEDFCEVMEDRLVPGILPAVLLDCDRRGIGFVDLGAALMEALRRSASGDEAYRFHVLQDLAEVGMKWHFEDGNVDQVLVTAIGDLSDVDESESYQWLESIGSMAREGYVLEWLAIRLGGQVGATWRDIVNSANGLLKDRRDGRLPACVLRTAA